MKYNETDMQKFLDMAKHTRDVDRQMDCDDCFEALDRFAELKLEGVSPEEQMPLVDEHLRWCWICRNEYKALLEAMQVFAEAE